MQTYPKKPSPCTCLNLRRASRAITAYYDHYLQPSGLSVSQLTLLRHIIFYKSVTMTRLAAQMRIDRTTLNRNLKPLAEQGLLEIIPGKDSRTKLICLKPKGEKKLQEALVLWEQVQKTVREYLGPDDADKLTDLTTKIEALVPEI